MKRAWRNGSRPLKVYQETEGSVLVRPFFRFHPGYWRTLGCWWDKAACRLTPSGSAATDSTPAASGQA